MYNTKAAHTGYVPATHRTVDTQRGVKYWLTGCTVAICSSKAEVLSSQGYSMVYVSYCMLFSPQVFVFCQVFCTFYCRSLVFQKLWWTTSQSIFYQIGEAEKLQSRWRRKTIPFLTWREKLFKWLDFQRNPRRIWCSVQYFLSCIPVHSFYTLIP